MAIFTKATFRRTLVRLSACLPVKSEFHQTQLSLISVLQITQLLRKGNLVLYFITELVTTLGIPCH